jgi:UDP-N-acetylmuramate--alanine ligase
MHLDQFPNLYFIGAGGIGMSALIRYFLAQGKNIAGYDRTPSLLTEQLIREGADIHFDDDLDLIPQPFFNPHTTLIIYSPAIPFTHSELSFFFQSDYRLLKRAQLLGMITRSTRSLCIAGTHGKTTTSALTAHIFHHSHLNCTAFLGGILKDYDSNLILADSPFTVAEADEFDRSFHHLSPFMAVITSADPDHLDIYGSPEAYRESFEHFTSLIRPGGALILKLDAPLSPRLQHDVNLYTYAAHDNLAHFFASNIRVFPDKLLFDLNTPDLTLPDFHLPIPFIVNVENAVAALALAILNGVKHHDLYDAIASFHGVARRFDLRVDSADSVLIDDYAHHPAELAAAIASTRQRFPTRHLTGIFQPHLFSRTRDFAPQFAQALSLLDRLILLDIYPARELPIPGISSLSILDLVSIPDKHLVSKEHLLPFLDSLIKHNKTDVILTLGAGDIDRLVPLIQQLLQI